MPELPEVETVRRTLIPHVVAQRIMAVEVRDPRLRVPVAVERLLSELPGRRVVAIRRRAKYLLLDLDDARVLMVHLGMSGRLGVTAAQAPLRTHDHVIWALENGRQLRFNDPRRFGLVELFDRHDELKHPRLAHLGVEPLDGAAFSPQTLYASTRGVHKPIKNFIMDAGRVVGVGNIYACESLFAAGIHPSRAAGRLSRERCTRLVDAIRATLESAIEQGGTTLRDFANADGDAGYFAVRLQVYGRDGQPCGRCATPITRKVMAGRSTFYCVRCQR